MSDLMKSFAAVVKNRANNPPGAGNSRPFTKEQAMLAKAKEIGERLDRLQTKLDAHAAEGEPQDDEANLPIKERFNRQVKRNAKK